MSHQSFHPQPPSRYPHHSQAQAHPHSHSHHQDPRRGANHPNPSLHGRGHSAHGHHSRQPPQPQQRGHQRDIQIEELSDRESTPVYNQQRPVGKFASHGYEGNRNVAPAHSIPNNHAANQRPPSDNRGPAVQGSATPGVAPLSDEQKAALKAQWENKKQATTVNRGPVNASAHASTQGQAPHPAPTTQHISATQPNPQRNAPARQAAKPTAQLSKPPSVPETQARSAGNKPSETAKTSAGQIFDFDEDDDGGDDFAHLGGSPGKLNVGVPPKKVNTKVAKDGKATPAAPPQPVIKFNRSKTYQEDGGLFCSLNVNKIMSEYKTLDTFKNDKGEETDGPSWTHINAKFESYEETLSGTMEYFNNLIHRLGKLAAIKNTELLAKEELTARYRDGGAQLATQCTTLQTSTHQLKLPDHKRRRMITYKKESVDNA